MKPALKQELKKMYDSWRYDVDSETRRWLTMMITMSAFSCSYGFLTVFGDDIVSTYDKIFPEKEYVDTRTPRQKEIDYFKPNSTATNLIKQAENNLTQTVNAQINGQDPKPYARRAAQLYELIAQECPAQTYIGKRMKKRYTSLSDHVREDFNLEKK